MLPPRPSLFVGMLLAALAPGAGPAASGNPEAAGITVFAAASLKTALDEASGEYARQSGTKMVVSYAASSALATQIENGAPADVFISADAGWMDHLAGKQLIRTDTRTTIAGNRLVLIAPASSTVSLQIAPGFDLAAALENGRLAVADVKAVPAGKYTKAALSSLGVWPAVETRLAQSENVRAALALVALGEVPLGIVYWTDAAAEPNVRIVGTFPSGSHPPIDYPAAVTATAARPDAARSLITFLTSQAGAGILSKHGFTIPVPPSTGPKH